VCSNCHPFYTGRQKLWTRADAWSASAQGGQGSASGSVRSVHPVGRCLLAGPRVRRDAGRDPTYLPRSEPQVLAMTIGNGKLKAQRDAPGGSAVLEA